MKRKFSIAMSLAVMLAMTLTSLVLAEVLPARIIFTTDTPCAVTVFVSSYTNPMNQPGETAGGSTPWTLDTYPSTSVTFYYPAFVVCGGTTYNFASASPGSPLTSGSPNSTTMVLGHYTQSVSDNTPPVWNVPASFSIEATGPSGAVVTYSASASDPDDSVNSQSCSPVSGSIFPLGVTTVNCTATDAHGNIGTASFNVTVTDTTPPALTLSGNITVTTSNASGAVVNFTATAHDVVDGSVPVTCLPGSDSIFPVGTTTVNCSASDAHSNTANGSFTVTVTYGISDATPPVWNVPVSFSVEATGPSGAVVTYSASANDPDDAVNSQSCLPASGAVFPLGTSTVNCIATDMHGNTGTASFNVTIVDTTPPALTLPSNMTVNATISSGAAVNFMVTATDLVDSSVPVTCLPASGSTFPVGTTTVNCSATDAHTNAASDSFTITVINVLSDTTPPVWTVPPNFSAEATGSTGATVTYVASASDPDDAVNFQACLPASGTVFPLGKTTVNCTATDTHDNTGTAQFDVTVVDTTPPIVTVPANIVAEATGPSGAVVGFSVSANDVVDGAIIPICVPASGSTFSLGTTLVTCSATDAHTNTASASFNLTVVDTTPPALTLPANLTVTAWNASGAVVSFKASANDLVDGPVTVTCSPASGSMFPLGTTTVNCSATDSHGNNASGNFTVTVQYPTTGIKCNGVPGHQILPPINTDGSSVFKQGSTIPVKFRICDAKGTTIKNLDVVKNFRLIKIISKGTVSNVDQAVVSATSETVFHAGNQQWIFNINTKNLMAGNTYIYLITLNDASTIQFQFSLK